jgi:autotransporter translocation and assembly factor TamB
MRMLTPFVRAAGITTAGTLTPRLSITGAADDPRIDGDLTIAGGEVRLADPRVLLSDLAARAVLTSNSATITTVTGTVNGGPLTGGGVVNYQPDGTLSAELTADVRGMALEFPAGLRSGDRCGSDPRARAGSWG